MRRRDLDRWVLPPIFLGEVRAAGARLSASCPVCRHTSWLDPAVLVQPDDIGLIELGRLLRCGGCGRRGGCGAVPEVEPWVRWLRRTRQISRLPWNQAFIPED